MPLIAYCPSCHNALRIGEEFQGRQMRCPVCQTIFQAPNAPGTASPAVNEYGEVIRGSTPKPAAPPPRTTPPPPTPPTHTFPRTTPPPRPSEQATEPHRGTAVLLLGVFSLVCLMGFMCYGVTCLVGVILGLLGWWMGHADLAKMKAGRMDRAGHGQTQGGYICSIIGTVVNALLLLLMCVGVILLLVMMDVNEPQQRRNQGFPAPPPMKQFK